MIEALQGREIIFEYRPIGQIVRVMVMDTKTMTEVIVSCPKGPEHQMQAIAMKRLEYVMRKKGLLS